MFGSWHVCQGLAGKVDPGWVIHGVMDCGVNGGAKFIDLVEFSCFFVKKAGEGDMFFGKKAGEGGMLFWNGRVSRGLSVQV